MATDTEQPTDTYKVNLHIKPSLDIDLEIKKPKKIKATLNFAAETIKYVKSEAAKAGAPAGFVLDEIVATYRKIKENTRC